MNHTHEKTNRDGILVQKCVNKGNKENWTHDKETPKTYLNITLCIIISKYFQKLYQSVY